MSKLTKALTAAAGNAGGTLGYVEDVFSTYIYDGNNTTNAIVNGLDLAGEGGMLWTKRRDGSKDNRIWDTERGRAVALISNTTAANGATSTASEDLISFNSNGFTFGANAHYGQNSTSQNFVSWSFRKAEKFFDVVTYTGNGSNRTISHSLGSVPCFIVVKRTDASGNSWYCYHSSLGNTKRIFLSETDPEGTDSTVWNSTTPTDSVFSLGTNVNVNASGGTYVAYLFASDAGGFGDDGDENIIKCGSYTGNATKGLQVNCGFEPQLIITKRTDTAGHGWMMYDTMRGFVSLDDSQGGGKQLLANSSNAEAEDQRYAPTATGFELKSTGASVNASGGTYIFIAIRRPMKTPEAGTEVFATAQRDTTAPIFEGGFPVDAAIIADVSGAWTNSPSMGSRLTGTSRLATSNTNAAGADGLFMWDYMNGWGDGSGSYPEYYSFMFKRATGFMDVVAYTGDGSGAKSFSHNLGVAPELMILKGRSLVDSWFVFASPLGASARLKLETTSASGSSVLWDNTLPTATQFRVGSGINPSTETYINYLFATLAGVSKVGSYTGTGSDLNVDCGFSAGARWIMIKRTDSTGDWYVWDSVRGIIAGNDPYLLLNSSAAQVTNTDYVDPLSSGFTVTSSAPAALNASGGSYIFLAIAQVT